MGVTLSGTAQASLRDRSSSARSARDAAMRKALPASVLAGADSLGSEGYILQITPAQDRVAGKTGAVCSMACRP